jgi:hypothetical protein
VLRLLGFWTGEAGQGRGIRVQEVGQRAGLCCAPQCSQSALHTRSTVPYASQVISPLLHLFEREHIPKSPIRTFGEGNNPAGYGRLLAHTWQTTQIWRNGKNVHAYNTVTSQIYKSKMHNK